VYPLAFLIEINLVEVFIGFFIKSFFNQLPVAVDIDVKFLSSLRTLLKTRTCFFTACAEISKLSMISASVLSGQVRS
jgi:hypothetical protein